MALADIILHKKDLVKEKASEIRAYQDSLKPSLKSLKQALLRDRSAFICEIKFSSPSQGSMHQDLGVKDVADIYAPFADALSVLADEKYFGGSPNNVRLASNGQHNPVLFKDVVVSPLQVFEARHVGAHAILLMLSVLDDDTYRSCRAAANALNMDVICEVHNEEEMERAKNLGAPIIGINNRNLKTLKVDLETSERLLPLVPQDAIVILESGFKNRTEIMRFSGKVHGFLIGTSLMSAKRIDLALRELLFGRVKICGLTNAVDARVAYNSGAYYGGLNFAPISKRQVDIDSAIAIKAAAPLVWGGVFVNQTLDEVSKIAIELALEFVQLHGDEDDAYAKALRDRLPVGCEIWRVIRVKNKLPDVGTMEADRIVLDTYDHAQYGGTGERFDWGLLTGNQDRHRYIVAGGIKPSNVKELSAFCPFGIDIASGVEEGDPRKKSPALINELFAQLRP